jgi:hypothetical protein
MPTTARRWIAILCLATILFVALAPSATGLLLATLLPLWLLFAAVVALSLLLVAPPCRAKRSPFLLLVTPRPPPTQ